MEGDFLAVLLQRGRADHHGRRVGQHVDERRELLLQRDLDRGRVHHLGLGHAVEQRVALELVGRIGHAVQVGLDGGGVEGGAVVELDALLELDRVDQTVLGHVVAVSQHVDQLQVLVEAEQALVERLHGCLRQRVVGIVRIERGERRVHGHHGVLGRERRGRAQHAHRANRAHRHGAGDQARRNHTGRHISLLLLEKIIGTA
ncbi:hypothetical protein D3C86_1460400 [compost metagenome]